MISHMTCHNWDSSATGAEVDEEFRSAEAEEEVLLLLVTIERVKLIDVDLTPCHFGPSGSECGWLPEDDFSPEEEDSLWMKEVQVLWLLW